MTEEQVAAMIADVLRWASRNAHSPALINIQQDGPTVRFLAVAGINYKLTVERDA